MKTRDLTDDERRELEDFLRSCNDEQHRIVEDTELAFFHYDFDGRRRGWEALADAFKSEKVGLEVRGIVGTLAGWRKVIG